MKPKFNTEKEEIQQIACQSDASGIAGRVSGVFYPSTIEELQLFVKRNTSITIRGAGTGLVGGCVPFGEAVVDLSKLNKIISVDKNRKTAEVEAGIVLNDLQSEIKKYGLEFPVQPGSFAVCTIGGMISTNAVGSRGMKYGETSKWIDEITVIDSEGELKRIKKLDIKDYSGMEGITGIIVKAKLKLIEIPERSASLFKFENLQNLVDFVRKNKTNKLVSSLEFFDRQVSEILGLGPDFHILVEFENLDGSLKAQKYVQMVLLRAKTYPLLAQAGYTIIEDPKISLDNFDELIIWFEDNKIPVFGHIGSGILHPCFLKEQEQLIDEMYGIIKKIRGNVSGEHGIGIKKKKYLEETDAKIIRNIKKRLDANNKFNPGKVV